MPELNMTKGERVSLTKDNPGLSVLRVELSWDAKKSGGGADFDLDASAFLLNSNGKLAKDDNLVYFRNKVSPCASVKSSGDNLTGAGDGPDETLFVDLTKVPADVESIDFIINIYDAVARKQNFGQVPKAAIKIVEDGTNKVLANYDLEENFSAETSLHPATIYRKDGGWSFKAVGAGYQRDLGGYLSNYKAA